ncbi:MAG: CotH kinase family protein, partial [Micropruina sp.]
AWITGDVVIDGTRHTGVGLRLKGNSTLKSVSATSPPESLPWLIRLDKYTAGANHQGMSEFIVRSNSTATALNEAVALDLLAASGLAAQRPALVRLRVNSSAEVLRLVVENPGREWTERVFAADGLLYKAEADGDYSYRGAAATSYDGVFDQEVGAEDATALIDFLDFVNNSDDATFTAQLGQHLDAEAFATYLGFEELIDNVDDIDGPGNNSYLWWAQQPDRMTVVAWDHNLAFGARPGTGRTNQPGAGRPTGAPPMGAPRSAGAGGPGGKANALVSRFTALADGTAKVAAAKERLRGELYTSGRATAALDAWTSLIQQRAADLVSVDVLASERATIQRYIGP